MYLTKAKILFAELQGISTLLKAQGTIWHKAYISMSQMMGSYNNFIAGIEDGTEQPVNFVEAQSDFSAQFKSLEELIKPYNDNIIQIWNKIQKFETAYKSRVVKFYEVESLSDGLSFYSTLTMSGLFSELSMTHWKAPKSFREIKEIKNTFQSIRTSTGLPTGTDSANSPSPSATGRKPKVVRFNPSVHLPIKHPPWPS